MRLLVIGNGFDRAHNLPTETQDFINFYLGDDYEKLDEPLAREFETLIDNGSNKGWCNLASININGLLWDGFESEIARVVKIWDKIRKMADSHLPDYEYELMLGHYYSFFNTESDIDQLDLQLSVAKIKENMIGSLKKVTRALEIYLLTHVNQVEIEPVEEITKLKPDYVISFNYTNTVERLYSDKWNNPKICYIHGKAVEGSSIEDSNLIFGIDEYLSDEEKQSDNYYIAFKKFYQRIVKKTGNDYKLWINQWKKERIPDSEKIYIDFYGHSLSLADKDIIRELLMLNNAEITVHYKDKTALELLVANMSAIIGPDKLIEMTGCLRQKLMFAEIA